MIGWTGPRLQQGDKMTDVCDVVRSLELFFRAALLNALVNDVAKLALELPL